MLKAEAVGGGSGEDSHRNLLCREGAKVNVAELGVGGSDGIETVQSNLLLAGGRQVALVAVVGR